jgi:hypothetical protein
MAEVVHNMKVVFGADAKKFKKGLDEGKQATKQFEKDAGGAFDSFAQAFGINLGKVREGLDKVKTSLTAANAGFKSAATGSNIFTQALKILKTAIIATGIGALIVALGSLISYFTKTQRGADFVHRVMKSIGAITSVLVDRMSALGEVIFKAFSNPKKAISDLWEAIKTNIVNRFEGLINLFGAVGTGLEALWKRDIQGLKNAATEAGTAIVQMTTGLDENQQKRVANSIKGVADEIKAESKAAWDLEKARQALEKREISFIETESRLRAEIDKNRTAEKDFKLSTEERLEANRRANELVLELERQRKVLQQERVAIMQQEIDLGESMNSDYRALAEEKAKLNNIEAEAARMQRELLEGSKTLQAQIEAETRAIQEKREAETEWAKPLTTKGIEIGNLQIPELETGKLLSRLNNDLGQAKNIIVDFADVFSRSFEGMADSFASNLGNMMAGTGNIKSFSNVVKESFGEMAVSAGRIIVKAGIAFFAIGEALRKAIKTPAAALAAVAAGIALMAVGRAAQASLNDVANGGGISSNAYLFDTRGASSNFGQTVPAVETQKVNVHVTGEFRQKGSDLVASINETTKRRRYN